MDIKFIFTGANSTLPQYERYANNYMKFLSLELVRSGSKYGYFIISPYPEVEFYFYYNREESRIEILTDSLLDGPRKMIYAKHFLVIGNNQDGLSNNFRYYPIEFNTTLGRVGHIGIYRPSQLVLTKNDEDLFAPRVNVPKAYKLITSKQFSRINQSNNKLLHENHNEILKELSYNNMIGRGERIIALGDLV